MLNVSFGRLVESFKLIWSWITVLGTYVVIFLARCLNFTFRSKEKEFRDDNESLIDILPDELMIEIFKEFSLEELIKCEQVCRRWRKLARDAAIWRRMPVVCSGQLGEISRRKVEIIQTHKEAVCCVTIKYILNYSVIKTVTEKCEDLIEFELIMCRIEKEFEDDIKKWPNLRRLNLKNSLLKSEEDLMIQYDHFKKLNFLGLSDFGLSSGNCESLLSCYNLNYLNIEKIRGLTLEFIKLLIKTKQCTLASLHIYGGSSVDDEVFTLLTNCPMLKELAVMRCESLSDKALENIPNLKKLKLLQLWNNTTFSESMLLKTLKHPVLIKLRSLSLSRVKNVSPIIVDAIAEQYKNLRFLALYQCPMIANTEYEKQLKEKFKDIAVVLY